MPDAEKIWLLPLDLHLKAVEDRLSPDLRAELEAEFADYLGAAQHPVVVGNRLVDRLCLTALGELPVPLARRQFGLRYSRCQRQTILGKVMMAAIPLFGMEPALRRVPALFANSANFGSRSLSEVGPQHFRLDFEDDPVYLDVMAGMLEAGIADLLHPPGLQITGTLVMPGHLAYDIRWQPKR
jgi:uncharacterized protein (TIGR02265 family)